MRCFVLFTLLITTWSVKCVSIDRCSVASGVDCSLRCAWHGPPQLASLSQYFNGSSCTSTTPISEIEFIHCSHTRVIPVGWLDTYQPPRTLSITNCGISRLPERLFLRNRCITEALILSNNPNLFLRNDSFAGLSCSLRELRLSNIGLNEHTIWAVSQLHQLTILDIDHNSLPYLPRGVFNQLTRLSILDVSANSLHLLEARASLPFAGLENTLSQLKITNTNLRTLAHTVFDPLRALVKFDFSSNQLLVCDCRLSWIRVSWLELALKHDVQCLNQVLSCIPGQTTKSTVAPKSSSKKPNTFSTTPNPPKSTKVYDKNTGSGQDIDKNDKNASNKSSQNFLNDSSKGNVDRPLVIGLTITALLVISCVSLTVAILWYKSRTYTKSSPALPENKLQKTAEGQQNKHISGISIAEKYENDLGYLKPVLNNNKNIDQSVSRVDQIYVENDANYLSLKPSSASGIYEHI